MFRRRNLLLFLFACRCFAESQISFNRDIRPILADHCFTCHGQDEKSRKANLRLDLREGALAGGKSKKSAIIPGEPGRSELLARVMTHDAEDVMPPADQKNPLSAQQIETLKHWIRDGAPYQGHWAFSAPEDPLATNTVQNPIDHFVSSRLEREGLKLSPEASPETLIRRVSLDITGIPPSPAEIDSFVADFKKRGESAYAALID